MRLTNGSLVVISPPALLDADLAAEIDALGVVGYAVVPNSFHYLFAARFERHYPAARLLVAPSLSERVPELGSGSELGPRPPADWAGELEHVVLGPVRGLSEVLFFHSSSRTLILTDLAFNMTRYPRALDRLFWRLSGVPALFGPGRIARSLLLSDREAARRCIARAAEWPFRRIVVAHGDAVEQDATRQFHRAFSEFLQGRRSRCTSA